ncbi:SDR family NAD(P)-dependent oxidoreductase [Haloactinomyces albus]|uniref:Glucose 1-dehydrogenase n=1 Tax=Haloactinomyces albus TaxID=1352928 RepID=A0AAE3ZHY7_9ACTN|nr:glucose 1-dehydrogenase [Haloactinomyces albus]MDR7303949.1 glucose 1-dehydrogenase [Haloactinomyces albus]
MAKSNTAGTPDTVAGKVVIVTGGGAGMGRATTLAFATAGAKVVVADISSEAGAAVADEITIDGGEASFVHTDVSRAEDVETLVTQTVDRYGRLDCAVNNAAITPDRHRIVDADPEQFRHILDINLTSMLLSLKYEIAQLLRQGTPGSIVNVGSVRSFRAGSGAPAYTSAKHGVIGLTRTAALEYAEFGVRVNAVCPGAIDTPMVREARQAREESESDMAGRLSLLGRLGTPEEVAQANLWLCSPASSLITGQAITADGGYLTR